MIVARSSCAQVQIQFQVAWQGRSGADRIDGGLRQNGAAKVGVDEDARGVDYASQAGLPSLIDPQGDIGKKGAVCKIRQGRETVGQHRLA